MAVEIKYVVIREGEEKMSFASKKEADAYDKMLDLAEVLNDWLVASPLEMDDVQRDTMAMWLAERKEALQHILRVGRLPERRPHDAPRRRLPPRLLRRMMTPCRRPKRAKPRQPERWRSVTGRRARCCRRRTFAHL
jgi:dsDNA-binding SOS-regulon protein